jgi:hypothetical protein
MTTPKKSGALAIADQWMKYPVTYLLAPPKNSGVLSGGLGPLWTVPQSSDQICGALQENFGAFFTSMSLVHLLCDETPMLSSSA